MNDIFDTLTEDPKKKKDDVFDQLDDSSSNSGDVFDQVAPETTPPAAAPAQGDIFDQLPTNVAGQPIYPQTTVSKEILKGIFGDLPSLDDVKTVAKVAPEALKETAQDIINDPKKLAAAAAYEAAGGVKGATLGYVDPTPLVDKTSLANEDISKPVAEGVGQFVGAFAPIAKIAQATHAGLIASGVLNNVAPVLQGLVQAGVTGSLYGAARKPEQEGLANRAANALDDAAGFIVLTGAGQMVDQAAQALSLGKTNAYNSLRQDIVDRFTSKGASPDQAEAMADTGLKAAIDQGGGWKDVTASDLRAARRAVRQGQKIIIGEGAEPQSPGSVGGQIQPPASPPGSPEGEAPAVSPETERLNASSEVESKPATKIDQKTISTQGIDYLTNRFPALAKTVVGQTLPLPPEQVQDIVRQAAAAGEEALLKGADNHAANIAALQAFHDAAKPFLPPTPPQAAAAAPSAPQAKPDVFDEVEAAQAPVQSTPGLSDIVQSLGLKPHELTAEQYGQAYGEGRPSQDVLDEHRGLVQKALQNGETVPQETIASQPGVQNDANKELARQAAQEVLTKNKIDDQVAVNLVNHIVADNAAFKATYGKDFNPDESVIRGVTRTPIAREAGNRVQKVIDLADGAGPRVGRHEAFHAVTNLLLDEGEKNVLLKAFGNHEAAADAFADHRAGKGPARKGVVKTIFDKIKKFLERLKNYFKSKKFTTAEDIFEAVDKGEMAGRRPQGRASPRTQYGILSRFMRPSTAANIEGPGFKNWFGESQITDAKGKPAVVYHATRGDFNEFSPDKRELGFHFAKHPELANRRVDAHANEELGDYGIEPGAYPQGSRVIPAYLKIEHPLEIGHDMGDWGNVADWKAEVGPAGQGIFTDEEMSKWRNQDDVRKALQEKGYDGVEYLNQYENTRGMPKEQRTSYIAFEPNQIKSKFNTGSFNEEPDIRYSAEQRDLPFGGEPVPEEQLPAIEENLPVPAGERAQVPTFYSQLQRVLEKKLPPKAPAAQIKGMIANAQDIKKEEIEWSGINEWLDQQKGSVTKEQVMTFLRTNETQLEEIQSNEDETPQWEDLDGSEVRKTAVDSTGRVTYELPNGERFYAHLVEEVGRPGVWTISDEGGPLFHVAADQDVPDEIANWVKEKDRHVNTSFKPKWAEYTLPSEDHRAFGEEPESHYRELLLTLPGIHADVINELSFYRLQLMAKYGLASKAWLPQNVNREAMGDWLDAVNKYAGDPTELLSTISPEEKARLKVLEKKAEKATFDKSHFSAKNVIAHARLTDRTLDDGTDTLFAEELQSDWFGKAHKEKQNQIEKFMREGMSEEEAKKKATGFFKPGPDAEKYFEIQDKIDELERRERQVRDNYRDRKSDLERGWKYADGDVGSVKQKYTKAELKELQLQTINHAKELREIRNKYRSLYAAEKALPDVGNLEGFPDAPFKNTWLELLAKRLLRMAAAEGYPRLSWTTAQQQTQRWSENYEDKYKLLYDEALPRFLNKYLKKWGVQVEKKNLGNIGEGSGEGRWQVVDQNGQVHQTFNSEEEGFDWISENDYGWSPKEEITYHLIDPDGDEIDQYDNERDAENARSQYDEDSFQIKGKWKYSIKAADGRTWSRYDKKAAKEIADREKGTIKREHVFQVTHPDWGSEYDFDTQEEAEEKVKELAGEFYVHDAHQWTAWDNNAERSVESGFETEKEAQDYIDRHYESEYSVVEDEEAHGDISPEVWSVPINDAMRESLLYEGQPLYKAEDVKRDINRVMQPSRQQEPKVYTERMALRKALQRESSTAISAFKNGLDRVLGIQTFVADAINKLMPESERGKYLDQLIDIQDLDAADKFIEKVQRDSARFAREADKNLKKDELDRRKKELAGQRQEMANLKRSLQRQAAAAKEGARAMALQLTQTKKGLADTISASLPPEERGRFLKMIASTNNWKQVIKAVGRIDEAVDKYTRKVALNSLKREVQRAQASKAIAIDYKWRMNGLLEGLLFQKPTAATMLRLHQLQDYIDSQRRLGKDVQIPQYVTDRLKVLAGVPIDKIPTSTIEMILNDVRNLADLGKTKLATIKELDRMKKERAMADIAAGSVPVNSKQITHPLPGQKLPIPDKVANIFRRAYNIAEHIDTALMPMDAWFDLLDGLQKYNGPNFRHFKRAADIPFGLYLAENGHVEDQTLALAKELNLTREQMEKIGVFAMAAQDGGIEKLYNNFGVNPKAATPEELAHKAKIDKYILSIRLDPKEKRLYDFMRKSLDADLPRVKEAMRLVYNKEVGDVKNYFPFMTDFTLDQDDSVQDRIQHQMIGRKKNVEMGFTESRVGAGTQKVNLNAMDVYLRHKSDVLYLIHMGQTIKYLSELANSPNYEKAVGNVGAIITRNWLDTLARKGGLEGARQLKWLDNLRVNTGMAMIPFRIATALIHVTPAVTGFGLLGPSILRGLFQVMQPSARRFLDKNFPEISRMEGNDPTLLDYSYKGGKLQKMQQMGYMPLKRIVKVATSSVALGAYSKWLADHDLPPVDFSQPANPDALQWAQLMARRANASSFPKDIPQTLSRGALTGNKSVDRAVFQYGNYRLGQFSVLLHDGLRNAAEGNYTMAARVLLALLGTLMATAAIRRGWDDVMNEFTGKIPRKKEKTYWDEVGHEALGFVPFVSQGVSMVANGKTGIPLIDTMLKGGEAVHGMLTANTSTAKGRASEEVATLKALGFLLSFFGLPGTSTALDLAERQIRGKHR